MQIFDRQYKLFGVINLIDLLVLVAVVVAGFAIYRVLAPEPAPTGVAAGTQVRYTVLCPSLRGVSASQVKVGDAIFKSLSGKPIGKVVGVRQSPTPSEAWNIKTNTVMPFNSTVLSDIWIDVTVNAKPTATGMAVGDVLLHGGMPMPVMTSTFQCDGGMITTLTAGGK